MKAKLTHIQL